MGPSTRRHRSGRLPTEYAVAAGFCHSSRRLMFHGEGDVLVGVAGAILLLEKVGDSTRGFPSWEPDVKSYLLNSFVRSKSFFTSFRFLAVCLVGGFVSRWPVFSDGGEFLDGC